MRRQYSLKKTIVLGKTEGSRRRGRWNPRWTGSIKEATSVSLQEPSGAAADRTSETPLSFIGSPGVRAN